MYWCVQYTRALWNGWYGMHVRQRESFVNPLFLSDGVKDSGFNIAHVVDDQMSSLTHV